MADFERAVVKVLSLEGGYQNDPNDVGNYNAYTSSGDFLRTYAERKEQATRVGTNRGISAGLYSSLMKRAVTVEEMKAITEAKARDIYKRHFWDRMNGTAIRNQDLAEVIFDGYVNQGAYANKLLQRVLKAMGYDLEDDGMIGPITVRFINLANERKLYCSYVLARKRHYEKRAAEVPGQARFLQGWLNRLDKFAKSCNLAAPQSPSSSRFSPGAILSVLALITILD